MRAAFLLALVILAQVAHMSGADGGTAGVDEPPKNDGGQALHMTYLREHPYGRVNFHLR